MKITDIIGVETEHLLAATTLMGGVTLRVSHEGGVALGQLTPAQAREVAEHLMESAARSEYESDLYRGMAEVGWTESQIGRVLTLVRAGEFTRHTAIEGGEQ